MANESGFHSPFKTSTPPEAGQDNTVTSEAEPHACWTEAQPR